MTARTTAAAGRRRDVALRDALDYLRRRGMRDLAGVHVLYPGSSGHYFERAELIAAASREQALATAA